MKKWFDVKASDDGAVADIHIFGIIGDWIDDLFGFDGVTTAKSFVDELAKLPESVKTIRVRLNSPGGDVFGGITIANTLRAEQARGRKVETIVEGLAASAASVVAMAGQVVKISDNALMMVHAPWSVAVGNATEMRASADLLDQIKDTLIKTYQWHSPMSAEELDALIDGTDHQGTWLDADAAIEAGLATEKVEGLRAAASLDPKALAKLKVPDQFRARVETLLKRPEPGPVAATPSAVIRACNDAGCPELAAELVEANATTAQVETRVGAAKTARAAATLRAERITQLCAESKAPNLAAGYIKGAMTVEDVKAHLVSITALVNGTSIDASLDTEQGRQTTKARIDTAAIYAAMNTKKE